MTRCLAHPVGSPYAVALCVPRQEHQYKCMYMGFFWKLTWLEVDACCMQ